MSAFDALTVGARFSSRHKTENSALKKLFNTKKVTALPPSVALEVITKASTRADITPSSHSRHISLQAHNSSRLYTNDAHNKQTSSIDNSAHETSTDSILNLPDLSNSLNLFDNITDNDNWCDHRDGNGDSANGSRVLSSKRTNKSARLTLVEHSVQGNSEACDKPLKPMSYKKMKHIWLRHKLQVTGIDVPSPIKHFSDLVRAPLSVPHSVVNNLFERGQRLPTPIQMQAIPALIHRRDVLACAPTGSGKTIAFLAPMFALLHEPRRDAGVRALIVSPTMELAQQIEREAFFLTKGQRWRMVQHGQSTHDKDFFISTPGRVETLLRNGQLDLSHVEYLVFDEGDRLWDSRTDFLDVLNVIIKACSNADKVVSLFTATLNEKIENAARSVMGSDPVRIIVEGRQVANTHVKQRLMFCGNELGKIVAIRNLISEGITPPVLIFVQSIERTKELYDEIRAHGLHLAIMNAKMSTDERESVITNYRLGKIWVLITTELLSRGIDFKNVGTVINFDFPITVDSYIHRIGRTGRAGKDGVAITFFTEADRERLPAIARVMRDSGSEVEDWMLEIKVDHRRRKQLEHTTPQRMIVSTRKRMLVAHLRTEREYKRLERDRVAKINAKRAKKEKSAKTKIRSKATDRSKIDNKCDHQDNL